MDVKDLGPLLCDLRKGRDLSIGEAARRSRVPRSTLSAWECGTTRPRGPALVRLLDALEVDFRLKARLLQAADARHAQIELTNAPLGAPVDLGMVIRAMRGRRGMTQADLARAAGVAQATVARWESGDDVPSGESLHAAAFALQASPEEALAMACAQGIPSGTLPTKPFENLYDMNKGFEDRLPRGPLGEIASLGLEAELWSRAVRDKRWDAALAFVVGDRAVEYFVQGRLGESEETARRGLRFPVTPLVRLAATGSFSALLEIATHQGADPALLAAKISKWTALLPDLEGSLEQGIKPWMRWEHALCLADMGRPDQGLNLIERDLKPFEPEPTEFWTPASYASTQAGIVMEIELRAGRGDRAEAWLSDFEGAVRPDCARQRVRVAHAQGRAADEETLEAMRAEFAGVQPNWQTRNKIAKIEQKQAELLAAA